MNSYLTADVIAFVVVKIIFALYNRICTVFILCGVSFIDCVVFVCCVFFSVACYFVRCVLCLIVVSLPPGKNPFAV
jgi:hypothetical protein